MAENREQNNSCGESSSCSKFFTGSAVLREENLIFLAWLQNLDPRLPASPLADMIAIWTAQLPKHHVVYLTCLLLPHTFPSFILYSSVQTRCSVRSSQESSHCPLLPPAERGAHHTRSLIQLCYIFLCNECSHSISLPQWALSSLRAPAAFVKAQHRSWHSP